MIGFVGLLVFGPERLKLLAKELGESLGSFKQGIDNATELHSNKADKKNED